MNNPLPLGALLLALAAAPLSAQTSSNTAPVKFPAGNASWTVEVEELSDDEAKPKKQPAPGQPPAGEANKVRRVQVDRQDKYRRDTVFWTKGGSTEYWWLTGSNMVFFQTTSGGPIRIIRAPLLGMRQMDESIFSWVSLKNYRGQKDLKGKPYDFYEEKQTEEGSDGSTITQTVRAWVDPETRRPVAWSDGNYRLNFEFADEGATPPLRVPPAFRQRIDYYEAYARKPTKKKQPVAN